jgi:acyl-CoA oxidase
MDYSRAKINAETLQKERASAKFNVREMIYLLEGGKEMAEVCSTRAFICTHPHVTIVQPTTALSYLCLLFCTLIPFQIKESMMREIERDPIFRTNDFYDLEVSESRERVMEKMRRALQYYQQDRDNQALIMLRAQLLGMLDPSLDTRLGVHVSTELKRITFVLNDLSHYSKSAVDWIVVHLL